MKLTFYKISFFLGFSDSEIHIFFLNLLCKYAEVEVKAGFLNELGLKEMIFKGVMIYSSTRFGHGMTEKPKK